MPTRRLSGSSSADRGRCAVSLIGCPVSSACSRSLSRACRSSSSCASLFLVLQVAGNSHRLNLPAAGGRTSPAAVPRRKLPCPAAAGHTSHVAPRLARTRTFRQLIVRRRTPALMLVCLLAILIPVAWMLTRPHPPGIAAKIADRTISAGQVQRWGEALRDHHEAEGKAASERLALEILLWMHTAELEAKKRGIAIPETVTVDNPPRWWRDLPEDEQMRLARAGTLHMQIDREISSGPAVDPVSDREALAAYRRLRRFFNYPERRDLRVLETSSAKKFASARRRLERGQPLWELSARFSDKRELRVANGLWRDVERHRLPSALARAAFTLRPGQTRYVKTQGRYYIFQLERVTPGRKTSKPEVIRQIKRMLGIRRAQTRRERKFTTFRAYWRARTVCRKQYVNSRCGRLW